MAKRNGRHMFTQESSWFAREDDIISPSQKVECAISGCRTYPYIGTFVCWGHLLRIVEDFQDILKIESARPPQSAIESVVSLFEPKHDDEAPAFVYYLMVSPTRVKIGTTRNLAARMDQLHTELQYIVAIERGSYDVERQRHREFADESIGKFEHFHLSDRLKAHIDALQPQRDKLMKAATTRKRVRIRNNRQSVAG